SKAITTMLVTTSANVSALGQTVTFTATVSMVAPGAGTPSGTVQFQADGSNLGSPVPVSTTLGVTTASLSTAALAGGTHTISASYSGDNNFTNSASNPITQTVGKVSTTTTLVSSANLSVWGQSVTFTVTVTGNSGGSPTGVVILSDGSTNM